MRQIETFIKIIFKNKYSAATFLSLFSLFVFAMGFRYIGAGDTKPNQLLPISIIHKHTFDFNQFVHDHEKLPYWFCNIKGRIVSGYPIVPGILSVPVYFIAYILGFDLLKKTGIFVLPMISSLIISSLSVFFMYLCLRYFCKRELTAIFFTLIYSFATCVWSVTCRGLWQHGPSLLFLTISLFLIFSKNKNFIPYAGFFLGMAVWNRPTNVIIALPLAVYTFLKYKNSYRKSIVLFIILGVIPISLMCLYSQIYLGSFFALGQGRSSMEINRFDNNFFSGFVGLLISPSHGLFVFSPIFLFSFAFLGYMLFSKKSDPIYKYWALSIIIFLSFYSKYFRWWGGHCFGYRYLIELIPLLIISLAVCWEEVIIKNRILKVVFSGFLLISVYIHFLGAFVYPSGFSSHPNDVDFNTKRLWDCRDTEITRCTKRLNCNFKDFK
jgi:hypothetical protein